MRQLPENQRRVAELSFEKDLSYEGVAEELQIPLGTVKSRLSRSRTQLRRGFAAQGAGSICTLKYPTLLLKTD